jgi:transcriptional regulator with XRE-family HTH domain
MKKTFTLEVNFKEVGARLKATRKAIEQTQRNIAKMCGIPTSTISEMEAGERRPHSFYLNLLANHFNVNLNWIFTGNGPMFVQEMDIKWNLGEDSQTLLELVYVVENNAYARHEILGSYMKFRAVHKKVIKKLLSKKNSDSDPDSASNQNS